MVLNETVSKLNTTTQQLTLTNTRLNQTAAELAAAKLELAQVKQELNNLPSLLIQQKLQHLNLTEPFSIYKDHGYVLANNIAADHTAAEAACGQCGGGYLVEIDDGDEYHFIVSFIKDKPKTDTYGYI